MKNHFCLESSESGKELFLAGNTPPNKFSSRGSAIITAFQFSKNLSKLSSLLITENNCTAITCLKRATSPNHKNLLLCGCLKSVVLVTYSETSKLLQKLKVLPQYHLGIINDMAFSGRFIYSVAKGDNRVGIIDTDIDLTT